MKIAAESYEVRDNALYIEPNDEFGQDVMVFELADPTPIMASCVLRREAPDDLHASLRHMFKSRRRRNRRFAWGVFIDGQLITPPPPLAFEGTMGEAQQWFRETVMTEIVSILQSRPQVVGVPVLKRCEITQWVDADA